LNGGVVAVVAVIAVVIAVVVVVATVLYEGITCRPVIHHCFRMRCVKAEANNAATHMATYLGDATREIGLGDGIK
jgi:hypothetical protein